MNFLKRLFCNHIFETTSKSVVYHVIENTEHIMIKCAKCGYVKNYRMSI